MKFYRLITKREWQELQSETTDSVPYNESLAALKFSYQNRGNIKRVSFHSDREIDDVIRYCVKNQDFCKNLYPTLEKLGLYHGRNTYNKDDVRFTAALKEAISAERAIVLEKNVESNSGMLPPLNNYLKLPTNIIGNKLTPEQIRERQLQYCDEENWIEFTVENLPNQPFTLFHHSSQKRLYEGKLDSKGHAYVKLDGDIRYVDVVFDKQQEDKPWYIDVPTQVAGGLRDGLQSSSDLVWNASSWMPSSAVLLGRVYNAIINDKPITSNESPIQLIEFPQAETVVGSLVHGVSQFLTGFIPAVRAIKFIRPLKNVGKWGKDIIAGGVADFTVFAPHEERLSNLIEEFPQLSNPITRYLQAKPDDSEAEGRLKNALEGLMLGALAEPLAKSLRALKYARIKWTAIEVRVKVHHKLEAITIQTNSGGKGNWNKALNNPEPNKIYLVDGNKSYHTDELSRLKQVDAELKLDTLDKNTYQQLKAGKQGIDGDEGGHLIASILGGSGEKINLLPMNANLNRGAWKQMENTWVKALEEGKTVKVKIEPIYAGDSLRPDKFQIKYSIDNGRSIEKVLINAQGGI